MTPRKEEAWGSRPSAARVGCSSMTALWVERVMARKVRRRGVMVVWQGFVVAVEGRVVDSRVLAKRVQRSGLWKKVFAAD